MPYDLNLYDLFVRKTTKRPKGTSITLKYYTKMAKKSTSKKQNPVHVSEVVEEAITQFPPQTAEEVAAEPKSSTKSLGSAKKTKMVEFRCLNRFFEFATEKAQLLKLRNEQGDEVKFWLSKTHLHVIDDADEPGQSICRIPAWLYFKAGLKDYFPILRWSQVAL